MRIALPPTISPAALADVDQAAALVDLGGETMGTTWSVRLAAPRALDAGAVQAAIVARLDGLVAEMSHWSPASLLSRVNRSPAGSWMTLPPDFAAVMARGLAVAEESAGAFDPAIGRLVDLWGFGPVAAHAQPDDAAVGAARAASGWRRLAFDPAARRLRQPGGLSLDLSGIAKGHAVDAVADLLHAAGIRHCLVEIGGELVGRGMRPDGDPWWVDLETPPGSTLAPIRIALHGQAVATSGNYRRGDHNLDPRTGRPVANGVVAVSVVGECAMEADAWATALTVLGPVEGPRIAAARNLAARIVTASAGTICEHLTPALSAMLED